MTLGETLLDFLPRFGVGLQANLSIALSALLIGLALGLPLASVQSGPARGLHGAVARGASAAVALMRASPTFVLMFFLLNAVPGPWYPMDVEVRITPWAACTMALACYCTAYVSDNVLDALQRRKAGDRQAVRQLVPACVRVFFVMVLSSGFAATVGVPEAVSVTMRTVEQLPEVGHRLVVLIVVVGFFTATFQLIYAAVARLGRRLERIG